MDPPATRDEAYDADEPNNVKQVSFLATNNQQPNSNTATTEINKRPKSFNGYTILVRVTQMQAHHGSPAGAKKDGIT